MIPPNNAEVMMMPPAKLRVRVGNNSPRYTASAGYEIPNAKPPAMATSHITTPEVEKDSASRKAPIGTRVAPNMRRPRSSATRPPMMRPKVAGDDVMMVKSATSAAEYPRSSFKYLF